jgi:hypothetical protein
MRCRFEVRIQSEVLFIMKRTERAASLFLASSEEFEEFRYKLNDIILGKNLSCDRCNKKSITRVLRALRRNKLFERDRQL